MSMKNPNDTIGNRTRDLPACSVVPQLTAPPAACPLVGFTIAIYHAARSNERQIVIYVTAVRHSYWYKEHLPQAQSRQPAYFLSSSVPNSTCLIHKGNPTRCNNVSKFYYSIFIWSSTCFGRHAAHHQEPKTALGASGFTYVEGCWTLSAWWVQLAMWRNGEARNGYN
jgi:hypothetical protein